MNGRGRRALVVAVLVLVVAVMALVAALPTLWEMGILR